MGFLSPDGTFWVQLINFGIFFAILNVVFLKPVGRAIAKRRAYLDGLIEGYDAANAEFYQLQGEIEGKRAAARRDAELVLSRARTEASDAAAAIASDYAERAQAIVEQAHRTVAGEVESARAGETAQVRELSNLMLQRVLTGVTQ